jgi:hypothetical protein
MDIVIIKYGFKTWVDVVTANLTCIDLAQHALMTTTHVTIIVIKDKAQFIENERLEMISLPLP